MKAINLKQARVGDLITLNEAKSWELGEYILIEAQTGRGKTFFIKTTLNAGAGANKSKILLLSPRSALKRQNEKSFIGNDNSIITFMNYQDLENRLLDNKEIGYYDYIVADECHYIYTDSSFNRCTDLTWKWLREQENSTKIFMSATLDLFERVLKNKEKIEYTPYRLEANYDYIDEFYYYENDDVLEKLLSEIPEDEKVIYFASATKAYEMSKKNTNASFFCSSNNKTYYKYIDKDIEKEIDDEKENMSCQILCTTNVLDAGVNIVDKAFKHVVVDKFDIDTIVQCVGRRRIGNYSNISEDDRIKVYIKNQKGNSLTTIYNSINIRKEQASFLQENGSIAFAEEYKKKTIYDVIDQVTVKDDLGEKRIEYVLNEMMYIKYLKDLIDIEEYRETPNGYMSDVAIRFGRDKKSITMLEEHYDAITLENKLDKLVGVNMFDEEQQNFKELLIKECYSIKQRDLRGARTMKIGTANKMIIEDMELPYIVKGDITRVDGKQKRYWMVHRITAS